MFYVLEFVKNENKSLVNEGEKVRLKVCLLKYYI